MGGKDLNLKKSWHVNLMSNQKKVWEAEQSALDERKKIEQLRRERDEERAMEEIAKLQEAAGGRAKLQRVDWMYQGVGNSVTGVTDEQESYLLGKRRVDNLILKKDQEAKDALKKDGAGGNFASAAAAEQAQQLSSRDLATKTALDPLMAIEMQRQRMMEEEVDRMMRKQKLREIKEKKEKRHSHSRRQDEEGDRTRHKRRRYSDDREDSRRDERDRYRKHRSSRRRNSPSVSRSRSPSPYRSRKHRERSVDRRRSRSPRHSRDDRNERAHGRGRDYDRKARSKNTEELQSSRSDGRKMSTSPDRYDRRRRNTSSSISRSRSPYGESRRRRAQRSRSPTSRNQAPSLPTPPETSQRKPTSPGPTDRTKEEERAAKLAAMQSNATQLEDDRSRRLAEMAERDARDKESEDARRKRAGAPGGYVAGLRKQVQDVDLGARLGASSRRGGMERLENSF